MNDTGKDTSELPSNAERKAKACETLHAFNGLNVLHIRRQVTQFLSLIGREGIFSQYTTHDISHIDKMLASLDWIIPDTTKAVMSPVDWLMTTLAIYFHDLGMLVTAREYNARNQSDFPRYCEEVLFGAPNGADYRAKVETLGKDGAERFLYQEWVRHKHAERIRAWISGIPRDDLGCAAEAFCQINSLLEPLGPQFRRDLALICESHHLNDLADLKKYEPSQPYGDSDSETANLQYCAVLLRTTDLLHITSDRTPTTVFKLINPTDPISQQEWAKQRAVTRLRPKLGVNDEGIPDEKAPRDTIEVHAYFKNANGFFGLTSYLAYSAQELKQSHDWVLATRKLNLAKHEFPWRKIDDTNIETEGFIRDSFEFTLDQAKILDLLTGHTLYNDIRVVLRELVQNALDAIRLQFYPDVPGPLGRVTITWDSRDRLLSVRDNGTGMSQAEISSYLLRVGSSRYQDPEFKKQFPEFSSISRFGIGVLSTFMIADSVEITTCHPKDDQARQLTLRSVHGKYLVRLLDKADPQVSGLRPSGTEFKLRVRPSVEMPDVVATAKLWTVLPKCDVAVQIDGGELAKIGHQSTSAALASILAERGIEAEIAKDNSAPPSTVRGTKVRILNASAEGVDIAYAVQWSEYFREWEFCGGSMIRSRQDGPIILGTCIEGIRVEMSTPGFEGLPVLALANLTGPNSPKTNVARSGLEATAERDVVLRKIYRGYMDHVAQEAVSLQTERAFSPTWAAQEARYLTTAFQDAKSQGRVSPISERLLIEQLEKLEVIPVEENGQRAIISASSLSTRREFWTVESELLRSAEPLIREAGTSASLAKVIAAVDQSGLSFPDAPVLCGVRPLDWFGRLVYRNREVDKIVFHHEQRRVDLRWVQTSQPPRWSSLPPHLRELRHRTGAQRHFSDWSKPWSVEVGGDGIQVQAAEGDIAVKVFGRILILPNTPVAKYLTSWNQRAEREPYGDVAYAMVFVYEVVATCVEAGQIPNADSLVKRSLRRAESEFLSPGLFERAGSLADLVELVATTEWRTFDTLAWRRSSAGEGYESLLDMELDY